MKESFIILRSNTNISLVHFQFELKIAREIQIGFRIITGYVIVTVHVTVCFTLLYLKVIIFNNLILLRISDDIELHVELLVQVRLSVRTT